MCRFVAHMGRNPVLLYDILSHPDNSLIKQSKHAKEGRLGLNADGFGIGWYNHNIDEFPGIFKSTQPAWNDSNLKSIITKVKSTCFMGHVRAATIGEVNILNNHPFLYRKFLFAHNGTIHKFSNIKRHFFSSLTNEIFSSIKGQTDSECLFALIMNNLYKNKIGITLKSIVEAVQLSINQFVFMQNKYNSTSSLKINSILTDGRNIVATRYISYNNNPALSLYYLIKKQTKGKETLIESVTISSEPLSNSEKGWKEVPINHMLLVDENLNVSLTPVLSQKIQPKDKVSIF